MKKSFVLRIDSEVYDALDRWASDEFRSTNGQIEWIIAEALKKVKRYPKERKQVEKKDMKNSKMVVILLAIMFSANTLFSQTQWWTGMSKKTGLALCISMEKDSFTGLYSPMQTQDPIMISSISFKNDTLKLESKLIGLKMNLVRHADNTFHGYWKQSIMKEDIIFYPDDTLFTLNRPQTPQEPYRFDSEEIDVDYNDRNGDKVHLSGTLTYPKGDGRYPTIVLVSGSGQQNRDEEIFSHRPFLVMADYFASRGIAVLRYDDREMGKSKGNLDNATTELFADDAEQMLNAIKDNQHVDRKCLGMGGHSEGGAIAPIVASRNKAVKFVVMFAGQGCTGRDVLMQQNEAISKTVGMSERLIERQQDLLKVLFDIPVSAKQGQYQAAIDSVLSDLTKEERDSIAPKGFAYTFRKQVSNVWMQAFLTLNPADYLPKVKCPILSLNGSKDCQVVAKPNLEWIEKHTNGKAKTMLLPNLNHLFQNCKTGSIDEYAIIKETFSPEAMNIVADWILRL